MAVSRDVTVGVIYRLCTNSRRRRSESSHQQREGYEDEGFEMVETAENGNGVMQYGGCKG
jgi:hypothetical protein